jgi:hypothetical protein
VIQDTNERAHPWMDVALERHHDFARAESMGMLHARERLAGVEFPVRCRNGMHVVKSGVAVEDFEGLSHPNAEHVWRVSAALLVEHHGRGRHWESQIAESVLHIDEYVLEGSTFADDQ